jgi:rubredoxin
MKILRKPKLAPTVFRCGGCGCEYLAEYGEYTVYSDILTKTYHNTLKKCKCPVCGADNDVNDDFEEDKL